MQSQFHRGLSLSLVFGLLSPSAVMAQAPAKLTVGEAKKMSITLVAPTEAAICATRPTPPRDSAVALGHSPQVGSVDWKRLFNQLLVWNIDKNSYGYGANEAADKSPEGIRAYKEQLKYYSLYYSPKQFNSTFREIVPQKVATSTNAAYGKREELLSYDNNKCWLQNREYEIVKQVDGLGSGTSTALIRELLEARNTPVNVEKENYFQTRAGKAVAEVLKDYLFVLTPGFGSHTIPIYTFTEVFEDANTAHGRPALRPVVEAELAGRKFSRYQDPKIFYAKGPQGILDLVHPMGDELGFSMGSDKASADKLAEWIRKLGEAHPDYNQRKLILVGYSKGTPIAHNMVRNHADIKARTALILTLAGVNQGAIPAEDGIMEILKMGPGTDIGGDIEKLQNNPSAEAVAKLGSTLYTFGVLLKKNSLVDRLTKQFSYLRGFLDSFGASELLDSADRIRNTVDTKEAGKIINGIVDMSIYKRLLWNLVNIQDEAFDRPINIMNLSVLTNIDDFALPARVSQSWRAPVPLTTPVWLLKGGIDTLRFSQDNVFLFLTSIDGFRRAAGGLFDTQVGWLDTKSLALDRRPIRESFRNTPIGTAETQALARDVLKARPDLVAKGLDEVKLTEMFTTLPRQTVLSQLNSIKNFNFVDLGEVRGTHWDVAFRQVYYDPKLPHYEHRFPRKAAMESFLETAALYLSAVGGSK